MGTKISVALIIGVMMMMMIMMTDIAESKIVCPDDVSQAGSQDIGIKFNDTVPPVVRFWVSRLICKKRKQLALLHPASPAPDVIKDDVRPSPIQYPGMGDVGAMTPVETTPSPGKTIKQFLLSHLLTRKRRSAYRYSYHHDDDDSDEDDDSDDSDDDDHDDDWRRGFRSYRHGGYGHRQHSFGYPTVYSPGRRRISPRLPLSNRRGYGPLGARYGNTRYGHREDDDDDDDDDWAFRNHGPHWDRDDDDMEHQYLRYGGTNGYRNSYGNGHGYGYRGSRLGYGAGRHGYGPRYGIGGHRSRYEIPEPEVPF